MSLNDDPKNLTSPSLRRPSQEFDGELALSMPNVPVGIKETKKKKTIEIAKNRSKFPKNAIFTFSACLFIKHSAFLAVFYVLFYGQSQNFF